MTYVLLRTVGLGMTALLIKMTVAIREKDDKEFYKTVKWINYFSGGSILAVVARIIYII